MRSCLAIAALLVACDDPAPAPTPDAEVGATSETTSEVTPDTSVDLPEVAATRPLAANDVSVLFPLPTGPDQDFYLRPSDPGRGGALLPRPEFERIGRSLSNVAEDATEYDGLRVFAIRFDPCFRIALDTACQPQIRLVFQILAPGGLTNDGAVHALYNLSATDLTALARELDALTALAPANADRATLDVSPALLADGLDGPYARALRALALRYAGPDTLARMTFMTRTNARSGSWEFGGFHLGTWPATAFPPAGPITIEGAAPTPLQQVSRRVADGFEFTVAPEFADPAGRPAVSTWGLRAMSDIDRERVHTWALEQQSAEAHTTDSTDCASCHLAGHVTAFLEHEYPALVTPALTAARGQRTIGPAEDNGDNLRAFGYFNMAPVITQRVANETRAAVAAFAALPR